MGYVEKVEEEFSPWACDWFPLVRVGNRVDLETDELRRFTLDDGITGIYISYFDVYKLFREPTFVNVSYIDSDREIPGQLRACYQLATDISQGFMPLGILGYLVFGKELSPFILPPLWFGVVRGFTAREDISPQTSQKIASVLANILRVTNKLEVESSYLHRKNVQLSELIFRSLTRTNTSSA